MTRTVAIIGAGQIGYAASQAFATAGWNVRVRARSKPAWTMSAGTFEPYVAGDDPPPPCDVLLDTIAYDESDVIGYDAGRIGRLIVVSSASVYRDAEGRTLDEATQNGFPRFAGPIAEDDETVSPGPDTYSTRKIRMERAALARFGDRATVLRPCAIHGAWSRHPREWWFVKRILDGRRSVPLSGDGRSQFQTTSVRLLGEAAERAARLGIGGVFNISDTGAPRVDEIGRAIAARLRTSIDLVTGPAVDQHGLGRTPWSVPLTMEVCGKRAAILFGLSSVPYSSALGPAVDWLADQPPTDWRNAFPQLAAYPWDLFDYAAEDRFLAHR